jgi:septum formation protein
VKHILYLASRSPRRRELLQQMGVDFEMLLMRENAPRGADVDETPFKSEPPDDYVRRVTTEKARCGWQRVIERRLTHRPVLSADTTVCLGPEILGKPEDDNDAKRMLRLLSGREHRVLTAVAVMFEDRLRLSVNESRVRFSVLTEATIDEYIATGEAAGKAGAYGIQGRAAAFIPELHGSFSGVMGLPIYETMELLRTLD